MAVRGIAGGAAERDALLCRSVSQDRVCDGGSRREPLAHSLAVGDVDGLSLKEVSRPLGERLPRSGTGSCPASWRGLPGARRAEPGHSECPAWTGEVSRTTRCGAEPLSRAVAVPCFRSVPRGGNAARELRPGDAVGGTPLEAERWRAAWPFVAGGVTARSVVESLTRPPSLRRSRSELWRARGGAWGVVSDRRR